MKQTVTYADHDEQVKLSDGDDHDSSTPIGERPMSLLESRDGERLPPQSLRAWRSRSHKKREVLSSAWWWFEVAGALIAVVSLFMTIAVLAVLDDNPINKWTYNIQPSSLLSTLTTVGKMGIMLVVASCISQLKWLHYQQPNRLSDLELYDEVSRGSPIGAAQMLCQTGRRLKNIWLDIIAILFALIILGSLAIDPMIQQILSVNLKDLELHNITGSIGSSNAYISTSATTIYVMNDQNKGSYNQTGPLVLQMTLLNQLASTSIQPDVSCPSPANTCMFGDLTTLGLCGEYSDVTSKSNRTCTIHKYSAKLIEEFDPPPPPNFIVCNYAIEGVPTARNLSVNFGGTDGARFNGFRSILDIIDPTTDAPPNKPYDIARMFTLRVDDGVESDKFLRDTSLPIPEAHVGMANWYWCERSYTNVSINHLDGKLLGLERASTTPLLLSLPGADDGRPDSTWQFSSNNTHRNDSYYSNFVSEQFMNHFHFIDTKLSQFLDPQSSGTLHPKIYAGGFAGKAPGEGETYNEDLFGMANFMSAVNMSQLTQNIATAVTNQVLTATDNEKFNSTTGTAHVANTPYYHVRWGWLVLPLFEAVATVVLLGAIMVMNKQPLLKSSTIAMLAHGPEDAADLRLNGLETSEKWEQLGKGVKVTWMEDEKGWTRLVRA